jgi:quinoprotein glucose dehydrogenase
MTVPTSIERTGLWPDLARHAYAIVILLTGAALFAGGIMLVANSGSVYYVVAGGALSLSGVMVWRRDRRATAIYAALLVATLIWSIYEIGFNVWGLLARLGAPCVLGIPLLFIKSKATGKRAVSVSRLAGRPGFALALLIALCVGIGLHAVGPDAPTDPLWARGIAAEPAASRAVAMAATDRKDWQHYGNDQGGTRFSPLSQISTDNVKQLELAWVADVGPASPGPIAALEVTPINIGDALYVCNGNNIVLSLDTETGRERWRYDMTSTTPPSGKPCRGVSYYRVPGASGVCAERIIATSQTPELFALDAATGKPCPGFGSNGRVRLLEGLGHVPTGYHYVSSAPQIVRGKAVFGGAVMDGQYWGEPPGVIRAFDLVTGRLAWAFDAGMPHQHQANAEGTSYTWQRQTAGPRSAPTKI